jgi:hypothetical protein
MCDNLRKPLWQLEDKAEAIDVKVFVSVFIKHIKLLKISSFRLLFKMVLMSAHNYG